MLNLLLEGQKEIAEQIKRVHTRLDTISEIATINKQSIKHLEKSLDEEKEETKERFNIVHKSIRRRDGHLKWLVASIFVPIVVSILAFLNISPK
ncbi:MAG: hypothetical protein GWP06_00265 [Actinobacteria bacterium]|nr:hypothetical protein [Actinomycetota bacterium]